MPRGDRTGPMGFGPMTGRGMGFCSGSNRPGYMNSGFGCGGGFGRGRGYRNMYYATGMPFWQRFGGYANPSPDDQKSFLQNQAKALEDELKDVRDRLGKLENQSD
jgi:hypothetical protein